MNTKWIDFKALRAKLDFETVLKHYGVEVKRKGIQHMASARYRITRARKTRLRSRRTWTVDIPVLRLRSQRQCSGIRRPDGKRPTRNTARRCAKWPSNYKSGLSRKLGARLTGVKSARRKPAKADRKANSQPALVNAPLDFELKGLDPAHPYLRDRGFTPETIRHFGLGFCLRGLLKDRMAIPLHDHEGACGLRRPGGG